MKAAVAGLLAVLGWATVFVVARFSLLRHGLEPVHFVWMRYAAAMPVLWLLLAARGQLKHARQELARPWGLLRYTILGATGCFGMSYFQAMALPHVQATTLSLMMSTAPITTVLLGFVVGERPGRRGVLGLILGFAGAGLILVSMAGVGKEVQKPPWLYYGEIMAFMSGACWALYTVLGKAPSRRAGGLVATTLAVTMSNVLLLAGAPALAAGGLPAWPGILAMVYVGVVPTALGFALWYYALRHMDAGPLSMLQYLSPALAFLMALALLEESITAGAVVGLALVVIAVQVALRPRSTRGDSARAEGPADLSTRNNESATPA